MANASPTLHVGQHHGRPRIPSKQDLLDFAFAVPESPPLGANRKTLQSKFSRMVLADTEDDKGSVSSSPNSRDGKRKGTTFISSSSGVAPFEGTMDGDARHKVCNDSLKPWSYLLTIPGKNVRDMLITAFNKWIGCDSDQLITIKQVVAYLHSASLIVDDIEDESLTRRGYPAAHVKFGVAPALNAANYVYFLALEKLLTLQSTDAVFAFTNEMCNLHRGQGRDIFWRVTADVISEDRYLHMVKDKTGGLFRLAIRVMFSAAPLAKGDPDTEEKDRAGTVIEVRDLDQLLLLCDDLAAYFQIRDDLINLASPTFHKQKGFCEDITEGKFSFIALHSLRNLKGTKEFDELLKLLQMKTTDRKHIKRALLIMHDVGSFAYSLNFLDQLKFRIDRSIAALGGNRALADILGTLCKDLDDCRDVLHRVIESKD